MDRNFVAAQRMPREIEEPSAASSLFYALFIVCGRRCPLSMRINAGVGHPGEGRFGKWEAWSALPGNVLSYTTTTCFRKGRREREGWRRNPNLRIPMAGDSHRRQPYVLSHEMTKMKPDDSFFFFF